MRVPDETAATPLEVHEAIRNLTDPQLLRLEKFGRYLIRGLGRRGGGRDFQDLIQEAMTATVAGDRRWNKQAVDFAGHLMGAMRSIASHWAEKFDSDTYLEAEVTVLTPDGREDSPLTRVPTTTADPERLTAAKQEIEKIQKLFDDDPLVLLIIEGLRDGMSGPEIQAALGISQAEYETGLKRLRRRVRADAAREKSND